AIGFQVGNALNAAQKLQEQGIKAEVIDLRMVAPLDKRTILTSVEKTGRLVVVEEGVKTGGVGAEIGAIVAEEGLFLLRAPVKRVASLDLPIPYSPPMEKYVLPNSEKIIAAVKAVMLD
ncbi:MAG TPA: transketolase C-terminal domain-containing protein, partial [Thermodesulfobacteriota bacterium]|nr:transketolase C-terminal domain-containing protein [Thermodesulfobacteriota bacterium]